MLHSHPYLRRSCLLVLLALVGSGASQASPVDHWLTTVWRAELPVAWELTRSGLLVNGMSSQSESFRETWVLEMGPGYDVFLRSPRGRQSVEALRAQNSPMPTALVLTDQALAFLTGVPLWRQEDEGLTSQAADLVIINIGLPAGLSNEYTIKIAKDELYAVSLNFGL